MKELTLRALNEYNTLSVHPGGDGGNPFWNMNATQFTFAPSFYFPCLPNFLAKEYLFTATDTNGKTYTFKADRPTAPLTPIWAKLPVGVITLKVEALGSDENSTYLMGARTFFKCTPFPGRENLPLRARSYKDAAELAFKFVFEQPMIRYWVEHKKPDPDFPHNVYPAKTISSVIRSMTAYARLSPKDAAEALNIAKSAADYMILISEKKDSPLNGLPPTYCFDNMNKKAVDAVAPAAWNCRNTTMLIYPASAGEAYLQLYDATGEEKYLDAAMIIANYYKNNVLPCGSWYLQLTVDDGKPTKNNYCKSFGILLFLSKIKSITQNLEWDVINENYFNYLKKICLDGYNWEGQFEDIPVTANYYNLTHIDATSMIEYIANNRFDDPKMVEEAKDLMRFAEDQFVVWGEYAPWIKAACPEVRSPAGLEQYLCYWPIDGSTSKLARTFLKMYSLTNDRLYFEKGAALADMLTRMQNEESGVIPTFWDSKENVKELKNFWINCHIGSAFALFEMAKLAKEI